MSRIIKFSAICGTIYKLKSPKWKQKREIECAYIRTNILSLFLSWNLQSLTHITNDIQSDLSWVGQYICELCSFLYHPSHRCVCCRLHSPYCRAFCFVRGKKIEMKSNINGSKVRKFPEKHYFLFFRFLLISSVGYVVHRPLPIIWNICWYLLNCLHNYIIGFFFLWFHMWTCVTIFLSLFLPFSCVCMWMSFECQYPPFHGPTEEEEN